MSAAQSLPQFLPPLFEAMPTELKQIPNWVSWVPIWSGSKWTKRPIQPSGFGAKTTNPKHWSSFDEVKQAYEQAVERGYIEVYEHGKPPQRIPIGGVGFVFDGKPDQNGLVFAGVDFDRVRVAYATLTSLAQERIARLGSYFERSVSGEGIHVIVKARPLGTAISHAGVEMYTAGRFFTMTGRSAEAFRQIVAAPEAFDTLAGELRAQKASSGAANSVAGTAPLAATTSQAPNGDALGWFSKLASDKQTEVVKYAALHIARSSKLFELTANGGNYQEYLKLTFAIARSGVQEAEDIFVEAASTAEDADSDEGLRCFFQNCAGAQSRDNGVTVGTLLYVAQEYGAEFDQWRRQVPSVPILPPDKRKPLRGGTYTAQEALELLNSHYLIGKSEEEVAIFRIKNDGSLVFTQPKDFNLDVANIFVSAPAPAPTSPAAAPAPPPSLPPTAAPTPPSAGGGRQSTRQSASRTQAEKFWKENAQRHQRKIVFKPGGTTDPTEYNLWRGFAVEPHKGWQKQRRLLRHILKIICRGDKHKFKYLIRWLAWLVQNPDKPAETVVVLKSHKEGTGKTTLGVVMCIIFGAHHAAIVDDKDRLTGRFVDWIEPMCFILAEEILWAKDYKTADKLKSMITGRTIPLERKNGGFPRIPNRLHIIMTTNHEHAVAAGAGDRRNVVYDVLEDRACDKTWFDPLYRDIDGGGASEFLWLLQNLHLGDWHPREILKTAEATEQQRMSGDSVSQWVQACIEADGIIGAGKGPYGIENTSALGKRLSTEALREAYVGYCRQHGLHPVSKEALGGAFTAMFGKRVRIPLSDGRRPWGYDVPDGETWQVKLDARLGIKT